MLKISAKHFLESIGDKNLIPNPDNIEWNDIKCTDIVIKRKPKWFWQHEKYFYDNFNLNEILDNPLPNDEKDYINDPEIITEDFEWNGMHEISGEIGGAVASTLSLDIEGADKVSLQVHFQNIMKRTLNYHAFNQLLKSRKVDLTSPYLKNLAQNDRNRVTIVSQYLYINSPTEIKANVEKNIGGKGNIPASVKIPVSVDDSDSYHTKMDRSIKYPTGTVIGFELLDLVISADGSIYLLEKSEDINKNELKIPQLLDNIKIIQLPHSKIDFQLSNNNGDINNNEIVVTFNVLNELLTDKARFDIMKHLFNLRIHNPNILSKLQLFILNYQQCQSGDSHHDDTQAQLTKTMLQDTDLVKILEFMGVIISKGSLLIEPQKIMKCRVETISVVLEILDEIQKQTIEHLYHMITKKIHAGLLAEMLLVMYNAKYMNFVDAILFEKLKHKSAHYVLILMSVGINEKEINISKELDPLLIILQLLIH